MKSVLVLGGGITGLSAAWKIAESGVPVKLIELDSKVGGMSASFRKDEFVLDYGTHGLHSSENGNEAVMRIIEELMGDKLIKITRKASIWFRNKKVTYPLTPKEILLNLNPIISIIAFLDFLLEHLFFKLKLNKRERNLEDWIVNRFGRILYNIYFGPYTYKVWGVSPKKIDLRWANQRIPLISLWDLFKRTFIKRFRLDGDEHPHSPYRRFFYYTDSGSGLIIENIAQKIRQLGVEIILNTKVIGVKIAGKRAISIIVQNNNGQHEINCDIVISTIPIKDFTEIIVPQASQEVLMASQSLRFRSAILLYLIIKKEYVTHDQWIYFSSSNFIFNRFSEFKNLSIKVCPPGKTCICIEITCFENEDIWEYSDKQLFEKCITLLEKTGMVQMRDVESYFTHRLPWAYPIWDLGYDKKMRILSDYFSGFKNIYFAGRQGTFRYLNMDQSIMDGFKTADRVINEYVNTEACNV